MTTSEMPMRLAIMAVEVTNLSAPNSRRNSVETNAPTLKAKISGCAMADSVYH